MNEEELKKGCGKRFCEDCGKEIIQAAINKVREYTNE